MVQIVEEPTPPKVPVRAALSPESQVGGPLPFVEAWNVFWTSYSAVTVHVLQLPNEQEIVEVVLDVPNMYRALGPAEGAVRAIDEEAPTLTEVVVPEPVEQGMLEGLGEGEPPETANEADDGAPDSATTQSMGSVTTGASGTQAYLIWKAEALCDTNALDSEDAHTTRVPVPFATLPPTRLGAPHTAFSFWAMTEAAPQVVPELLDFIT